MAGNKNFYVVFMGRKVGIFNQWIDCHTQVVKFKNNAYKGYQTLEEADEAWQYFCNTGKLPVELEGIQASEAWSPGPSTTTELSLEGLTLQGADDSTSTHKTKPNPNGFLVEYSNQALLIDVCQSLSIPPPALTLLDTKVKNGVPHHRYGVCVVCDGPEGRPLFIVGEFNSSHEEAQDNASWLMVQQLVGKVGKNIKDYNYHIVHQLEQEMRIKDEQIRTMADEISAQDHEIESLKSVLEFLQ